VTQDRGDQLSDGEEVLRDVMAAPGPPDVNRDRRYHGGASDRPDDDELAERTAEERVDAGLADFAPGDVPAATDDPVPVDIRETAEYEEARTEVDAEVREGEMSSGERPDFPPSSYPTS
jgi:hypothetical protein